MSYRNLPYNQSLTLLTDLYQLTMACSYWKTGIDRQEAVFQHYFRRNPFQGGFTLACGLGYLIDLIENFHFDASDLHYLASLRGNDGQPLFDDRFLSVLGKMEFQCDVDAVPEATVVFPYEPLVRVQGPILQCQLLETVILNVINFQSLIATKAARVCLAAEKDQVLEFGLRRAQGIDGGLAASRAAYIGGCSATSNLLAGKIFGIPVRGTHAHSWVMSFDQEQTAFRAYAEAMPNNCVFLVDTYDTREGVKKAIEVGKWLRTQGHEMAGIRLDSGDLAYLSIEARKMLDEGGFPKALIVASNDLDETIIQSLKEQGAQIAVWGVGTRLITGHQDAALGGVYKLSAVRPVGGQWKYRLKLSEQAVKISNPGILQVRRYRSEGENVADVLYDVGSDLTHGCVMVDPMDRTRVRQIAADVPCSDLLVPVFRQGRRVYDSPSLEEMRQTAAANLQQFHAGIKRFVHPHAYPVGLEQSLFDLKTDLILSARGLRG